MRNKEGTLNLLEIAELPPATIKQLNWLHTVHAWGCIPDKEYQVAVQSFNNAQKCISKYYNIAHEYQA